MSPGMEHAGIAVKRSTKDVRSRRQEESHRKKVPLLHDDSLDELPDEPAIVVLVTSYPPRECGIATYSQDLVKSLASKFSTCLSMSICALESGTADFAYPDEVRFRLDTTNEQNYSELARSINRDNRIRLVMIQHEFGFFHGREDALHCLLADLEKPVVIVFHTVLPHPDPRLMSNVQKLAAACGAVVVMTHTSASILSGDYSISPYKISVIAHGTHLVPHVDANFLKSGHGLKDRRVLTTFGLLGSGKNIETTLNALPRIVQSCPDVMFLVIGKTHPEVLKHEGENYRNNLESLVERLELRNHVRFVNKYLSLHDLLDFLQLTDIYLFTTNDPNQAVSGTFVYAMSCACPILSTPIPHAKEVLSGDTGIIFDFGDSSSLAEGVLRLLNDEPMRKSMASNTLQKIVSTAWENSAVAHAILFQHIAEGGINLRYDLPPIDLDHLRNMTTSVGIIQFAKINQADIETGYTLDDNARALVVMCGLRETDKTEEILDYIRLYFAFVKRCQLDSGSFMNYVDKAGSFTEQNGDVNLDDSNGRALWALGFLISKAEILPSCIVQEARELFDKALGHILSIRSTRAMAFAIKGLFYRQMTDASEERAHCVETLAERLASMYRHESRAPWTWFEGYLTYANSVMPEAMLHAWILTGNAVFRDIAVESLDFLISQIFNGNGIEVVSNRNWRQKGGQAGHFGEQPIDVAYTVMTLSAFHDATGEENYRVKMDTAFAWFLGNNRLHQIIYNPCTGGCYDGLEETHVNLNQGAESTLSYLMARLAMGKYQ